MAGIGIPQRLDDGVFGGAIHFTDKITVRFARNVQQIKVLSGTIDNAACAARGSYRDSEHWMHCLDSELKGVRILI